MVVIFLFFGYQKWFDYEAQTLISYIGNGPLIFWRYPLSASAAAGAVDSSPLLADQRIRSAPAGAFFLFENSIGDQVLNIPQRRVV